MNKSMYLPEDQSIHERIEKVDKAFQRVRQTREHCRQSIVGLTDDVFKTEKGFFGSITSEEVSSLLHHMKLDSKEDIRVTDLGSGSGRFAMLLASIRPDIEHITGIEYDRALHEVSQDVLSSITEEQSVIRDGQVDFQQGDFFDARFIKTIQESDTVFYYLSSCDEEDKIERLIGENLMKPKSHFIAFGDNDNPFPNLEIRYGFTRLNDGFATVYTKV